MSGAVRGPEGGGGEAEGGAGAPQRAQEAGPAQGGQ